MLSELITDWSGNDEAVGRMLRLATNSLHVFDDDLSRLGLERHQNAEAIENFLRADRQHSIDLVLRQATTLRRDCPRLLRLLATYPRQMRAFEGTPSAGERTANADSLILADDCNALVRFAQDQPRARLITGSASQCAPYVTLFYARLASAGQAISITVLGL